MKNPTILLRALLWLAPPTLLIAGILRAIGRKDGHPPEVVVKLRENTTITNEARKKRESERFEQIGDHPEKYLGQCWERLTKKFPQITIRRLIKSVPAERIQSLVTEAKKLDRKYRDPNFLTYFTVRCPSQRVARIVAKTLRSCALVETSYVQGAPSRPPDVILSSGEGVNQKHLGPSPAGGNPGGIDARYAWKFPGGDGEGIQFVDLEWGWCLEHEDLPKGGIQFIQDRNHRGTNNKEWQGHGTAVLGIVLAEDNNMDPGRPDNKWCVGITPHVKNPRVVSPGEWDQASDSWKDGYSVASAIFAALNVLQFGDVLLLEVQTKSQDFPFGKDYPVEVFEAEFQAIQLATSLGIVVVEAAGNRTDNLDRVIFRTTREFSLNRSNSDFPGARALFQGDSGAIMVGSAGALTRSLAVSNYGSRIDCYACDSILTTGYEDDTGPKDRQGYPTVPTKSYCGIGGTSPASAIIAGAALAVQGIAQAKFNRRFSPSELRNILSDPNTGTPSADPSTDRIGVMPDLREIITNINDGVTVPSVTVPSITVPTENVRVRGTDETIPTP